MKAIDHPDRRSASIDVERFFEASPDVLVVADARGQITQVNAAWRNLLGHDPRAVISSSLLDHVHPEDRAHAQAALASAGTAAEGGVRFEARCRDAAGRFRALKWHAVESGGRVYATARDVSATKDLDRLKGEFVSIVSHELRTPLTAIRGALGLLVNGAVGALPPEILELVTIADTNAQRLGDLVEDLLDVGSRESAQIGLRLAAVDPYSLVAIAVARAKTLPGAAYVTVEAPWSGHDPVLSVRADKERAIQMLGKLLSNAVKCSPRGGRVAVRAERVDRCVRFSVSDQGPGIALVDQSHLFRPFSQLDASDARRESGGGLGLAMVRAFAEAMTGRAGVASTLGQGSAFWFELPIFDARATQPPGGVSGERPILRTTGVPATRPVVLVVDADAALRAILSRSFDALGMEVIEANDGAQCIHLARTRAPAALVLDVDMPRPDGYEVIEILRSEGAEKVPLVVYTGSAPSPTDRARLAFGPTTVLVKGHNSPGEVAEAVQDLLRVKNEETKRHRMINDALAELQAEYRVSLPGRVEKVLAARALLAGGEPEGFKRLRELAHALRGTAGSYGFAEISRAAGDLEELAGAAASEAETLLATEVLLAAMNAPS